MFTCTCTRTVHFLVYTMYVHCTCILYTVHVHGSKHLSTCTCMWYGLVTVLAGAVKVYTCTCTCILHVHAHVQCMFLVLNVRSQFARGVLETGCAVQFLHYSIVQSASLINVCPHAPSLSTLYHTGFSCGSLLVCLRCTLDTWYGTVTIRYFKLIRTVHVLVYMYVAFLLNVYIHTRIHVHCTCKYMYVVCIVSILVCTCTCIYTLYMYMYMYI